jgi:SAM-dependent methyltransferase
VREIGLDELPAWSPWPERLLGLAEAPAERRTPDKVMREYDGDKYGPLLDAVEHDPSLSLEAVKRLELGDPAREVAMSIGDRLYVAELAEAFRLTTEALVERVVAAAGGAAAVVDLGCGYGYQLAHVGAALPGVALHGGEYAPRAVELARRLHGDRVAVERFDFHAATCEPLETAPAPALVVLSYVVDQLPTAAIAVDLLARHRDRIARVLSFDVEASVQDGGTLLGLLRRRYAEVNDYSSDLLGVLRGRSDVRVESVEPNVIGPNALLPASAVVWSFA